MIDPCDNACRGTLSFQIDESRFIYDCSNLPNPRYFGLSLYETRITSFDSSNQEYELFVNEISILRFRASFTAFNGIIPGTLNPNFTATLDSAANALIVATKNTDFYNEGVVWRFGTGAFNFSSCLLLNPNAISVSQYTFGTNADVLFPASLPPAPVPLRNYQLGIIKEPNSNQQTIFTNTIDGFLEAGSFVYNESRFSELTSVNGYTLTAVNNTLRVTSGRVNWIFLPDDNAKYTVLVTVAPLPPVGGGIPTPQPPTGTNCSTLFGELFLTADKKQIAYSKFLVTLCANPCANNGLVKQERRYEFYATNVASVVIGCGCTLFSKAQSFRERGDAVTVAGLAAYGMLRLMLSLLLFGRFDLNYLRRSCYQTFLDALDCSDFSDYAPLFRSSPYWMYYLE